MKEPLRFDPQQYTVRRCTLAGRTVEYRAFEGVAYCAAPADPIQTLNLYAPEAFYQGGAVNGYTLHTAPVFMPNTVGGYMPGPADTPGPDRFSRPNAVFCALEHGYVVACIGVRGRTSGRRSEEFFEGGRATAQEAETGRAVGRAPALIVDLKAGIRFLRSNRAAVPGNLDRIVTSGTSAGGALSALAGASGNSPLYRAELEAIGAADAPDDIFAANCYCPIHNLEHADAAYEWMFCGHDFFSTIRLRRVNGQVVRQGREGVQTAAQQAVSRELKALFPAYLNSLHLTDAAGAPLTLDKNGEGSFKAWVARWVIRSAQQELETHNTADRLGWLAVAGSAVEQQGYLTIENGGVTGLDWDGFVSAVTRMKTAPAFDALDLSSPENEEFGTETIAARHFTAYSCAHSRAAGQLAEPELIFKMNPTCLLGTADTAPHWRIRHGAYDRDTALAIPVILATLLENRGLPVDFALPWGLPHSGDYDLPELFAWIDGLCRPR